MLRIGQLKDILKKATVSIDNIPTIAQDTSRDKNTAIAMILRNAPEIDFPKVPSFNIPLGALIPKNVDNLILFYT